MKNSFVIDVMELNAVEMCRSLGEPAASIYAEKRQHSLLKDCESLRCYPHMLIIPINFIGVFNSMWIFRSTSIQTHLPLQDTRILT
jgi:hypothetical protein